MGRTTGSTLLELLDAFRRESLATESGESSIPRCDLALEKDATRPYTVIRAPDSEIFTITLQNSSCTSRELVRSTQERLLGAPPVC
jgi:hypothetical protein